MGRPKAPGPKAGPLSRDTENLLEFWRSVVSGNYTIADGDGIKSVFVPIELRLRASELLAKYTVPTSVKESVGEDATVTPEILRVAQMLEHNEQYTDEDLRRALTGLPG